MNGYLFTVHILIQYLLIGVTFGQAVPLGSNCSQQDACVDSNSVCSSGKCVCEATHYDSNGENTPDGTCTTKVPLGIACPQQDACEKSNSMCSSGKCVCQSYYYDSNGVDTPFGTCEIKVPLGSACPQQDACKESNSMCSGEKCVCQPTHYDSNDVNTPGGTCETKVPLGSACPQQDACKESNSMCSSGKCVCQSSYYDSNGVNSQGGSCSAKQILEKRCPAPTPAVPKTETCFDSVATCELDQGDYICKCRDSHYDSNGSGGSGGSCTQKVSLGSECPQQDACVDSNSMCSSRKCVCMSTHYDSNGVNSQGGTCTTKVGLGYRCPMSDACLSSRAQCVGTVCKCKDNYYDDNTNSNFGGQCRDRKSLEAVCDNPTNNKDQCRDPSATCTSLSQFGTYTCTCNSGYHQESTGCVANKALGEVCNPTSSEKECSDPEAACIGSKCTCNAKHYDDNGQKHGGTCFPVTNLQVTNIHFTSIQTSQMTVSWAPPADYSQFITAYKVKWIPKYDNSINEHSKDLLSSTKTTLLSSGIDPGRAYTVTIVSENNKTQQDSIRSTSVWREQAAKPGITSNFSSSDLDASDGSITVAWSAPAGYVSNYKVQLFDDGTVIETKYPASPSTSFSPSGLKNGYRYTIKIQANSETFNSRTTVPGDTYSAGFKTMPKLPNPPTASTCNNPTDSSIKLSWSVPEQPNGYIIQYRIYMFKDGSNVKTENTKTNGTTFLVSGLAPGTQYTFKVYTENELGVSTTFDSVSNGCKTRAKMSEKPRNLKLTGVTSRGFNIFWTRPDNTYSQENYGYILQIKYNQDICKEEVFFKCSDCNTGSFKPSSAADKLCKGIDQKTVMKTTAELNQEISYSADLDPDILYTVYVAATTDAGMRHPAKISQLTLEEAPQQPEIVSVIDIEATSVTVTWNIADPRPGQTSYEIKLTADQPAVDKVVVVEGFNNRSVAVTGLEEYWNYQIKVTASTSKGSSASNEEATQTKPAAPGKVSNFKIIEAFGGIYTLIKINWQAPPILDRNGVIKDYSFVYNAEGKNATTQTLTHVSLEEHEYSVVVDVIPEDTYTFQVYASNQQNMKGEITTVVKKTPAGAPERTEKNCTTQSVIIGVVLGLIIVILLLYAGYTTLLIRKYRANKDDSVIHKVRKSDSRGPMYVNESFMVGVAAAAEGPNNPALNKDSETEYSRLDENTRDDKATYEIIQAM